jgi:hypothetical protein
MRHAPRILGLVVLGLCLLSVQLTADEPHPMKTPLTQVSITPTRVEWLPQGDHERLVLTIAGPDDFYLQRELRAGEAPSFSPLDFKDNRLPDGIYAYELRAEGAPVQSGHLWVQEGRFVDKIPADLKPPIRNITAQETVTDDLVVQGQACIGGDCVSGDGNGPALKIKEFGNYQIKFDALNCCYPSEVAWILQANDPLNPSGPNGDFLIRTLGTTPFRISPYAPDNTFTIFSGGNIGLGTLTPAVRLDVKANATGLATARLQNSSATGYSGTEYLDNAGNVDLFFGVDNAASTTRLNSVNNNPIVLLTNSAERMRITSGGNVGIGTATPGARLEVSGGEVRFPPGAGAAGFTHFNFVSDGKNYIRGTTIIADNAGSVGIGTASPSQKLEVELNQDANTIGLIENTNAGANANAAWQTHSDVGFTSLITHGSGRTATRFGVTLGGRGEILHTSGNGLLIGTLEADDIIIGTNNTNRLQISGSTGTVTVAGNMTVNGTFSNPSSRELKEGFQPVDPRTVLDKFARLPIQEWSYKSDTRKLRHVGPTVEDFQTAFGLGTEGQYIFPMDVQGVTMTAVQGLYQLVQEKDAKIAELAREKDAQIAELQKELLEIKQLLLEKVAEK